MVFHKLIACVLLVTSAAFSAEVVADLRTFVAMGLQSDPRLGEVRATRAQKVAQLGAVKAGVILPKFEVSMAWGPSPGLKQEVDDGDTVDVYDFSKIGPYFGTEIKVAQPLNFGQLRTGLQAARADLRAKEAEIRSSEIEKEVELQKYYFGYMLAREMKRLANEALTQYRRAEGDLEDKLDNDDPGVSQNDLLEMRASSYEMDKAVADADQGFKDADLAIRFALGLAPADTFATADSVLSQRTEVIPSLDSLRDMLAVRHPDLQRLRNGLIARRDQVELAAAKLGPEFFIFGSFKYAKSWAGDRNALNRDAFAQDPVNTIDGSIGLGVRYNLNFWNSWEKYRAARIEYRQLALKDGYAERGLELLMEQQYNVVQTNRIKLESARKALRAADALLKGAAMRYDMDKSETSKLVDAYKKNLYRQKDYYFAVHDYNMAVAQLFLRLGWSLNDYQSIYSASTAPSQGNQP